MVTLKPHDVVLALKLKCNDAGHTKLSTSYLAESLKLSRGEISKSINRLGQLEFIRISEENGARHHHVLTQNLVGFLVNSIRYVFKPEPLGVLRGIPTSFSYEKLPSDIVPRELPLVWATPRGVVTGEAVEPLYPGVPHAAEKDPSLYQILALVAALRAGEPRETKEAKQLLSMIIRCY